MHFWSFTWLYLPIACSTQSDVNIYYVSTEGIDHNGCGSTLDQACGTMYYASSQLNIDSRTLLNNPTMIIYDGQNTSTITTYFKSGPSSTFSHHPCLPVTFEISSIQNTIAIEIYFNSTFIRNMNDWFPNHICYNNGYSTDIYSNDYIFDVSWAGNSAMLILTNLIIEDYDHDPNVIPYGLIRNTRYGTTCDQCLFSNVSSKYILMNGLTFIYNSSFINLHIMDHDFISYVSQLYAGQWRIYNSKFLNSYFSHSIFHPNYTDDIVFGNDIRIIDCDFVNITTGSAIIYTETMKHSNLLTIQHTHFQNIIAGSIIVSIYDQLAENHTINLYDVFISTAQQENQYSLFYFGSLDLVIMRDIYVQYYYDFNPNCKVTHIKNEESGVYCKNPISFIENHATTSINNISFSIDITLNDFYTYKHAMFPSQNYTFMLYEQNSTDSLCSNCIICNVNEMNIVDSFVNGVTFGYYFISTLGQLSLTDFHINAAEFIVNHVFHPNVLQSSTIVFQYAQPPYLWPNLSIVTSNLTGSRTQVVSSFGIIRIDNSLFQYGTQVLSTDSYGAGNSKITITKSLFYRIGRYYGPYRTAVHGITDWGKNTATLVVKYADIELYNNTFLCFDPSGFHYIGSPTVTLTANKYNVDYEYIYYNAPFVTISFDRSDYGLIQLMYNSNVSIIENEFILNKVDVNTPWIYFSDVSGIACLSGNDFTNFAFLISWTNITSCTRPHLIKCLWDTRFCSDGTYGEIEQQTYVPSTFKITDKIHNIFESVYTYSNPKYYSIALDNVRIEMLHVNSTTAVVFEKANVLFLDTVLLSNNSNADIWYDNSSCNVIYNDRLSVNIAYISKVMVQCVSTNNPSQYVETMESNTSVVNHFSAIYLQFEAQNSTYFPGSDSFAFDFKILDIFGNVINNSEFNFTSSVIIVEVHSSYVLALDTNLQIHDDGICYFCDGMVITGANLIHTLHQQYSLYLSLYWTYLLLTDTIAEIYITACPSGYGASDNGYLCQQCPRTTYNLLSNTTDPCNSCDEHINDGIECINGEVRIGYNYWMKIQSNTSSLSSALCPYGYCCQDQAKCRYVSSLEASTLCAPNRNPFSTLCSECMDKHSQVFRSKGCKKCDQHHVYPLPLVVMFFYSLFIALYLLYDHSKITSANDKEMSKCSNLTKCCKICKIQMVNMGNAHLTKMIKLMLFNGLLYYEQCLFQMIVYTDISTSITLWWISLFNISILENGSNGSDGYCFYNGMTSKGAILVGFLELLVISFILISFKFIGRCCKNTLIFGYQCITNYAGTFLCFLLLSVGKVSSILFSLLSCQTINNANKSVHFNFGYEDCYGITWYLSFLGLIILILIFVSLFRVLYKMSPITRQNSNENPLYSLTNCYKPQYYYWEFIIFFRRVLLAFLSIAFQSNGAQFALLFVLLIFLYAHHKHEPFVFKQMNDMEFLLMALLCGVTMIDVLYNGNIFWMIMVTIFAFLPVLMIIYYIIDDGFKSTGSKFIVVEETEIIHDRYVALNAESLVEENYNYVSADNSCDKAVE